MNTDTRLWHPFADMAAVRGNEIVITRGEGIWIWDDAGNRYIDGSASLWFANVGHGRKEIADAVAEQFASLECFNVFGDNATPPALELADVLAARAPMDDARVFFTSGGGDSIDSAAKLARHYWQTIGQESRLHIISRVNAYHGTMAFGTSIGGIEANRLGYGPLVPSTSFVPHDSAQALRDEIERVGPERVAAFFIEPVIGAGGVYPPAPGYMEEIAAICEETGVLLVVDAVICGFGRLGTWFAAERFGVRPDVVTFAKGVTSGYLPLGGILVSGRVAEPFWSERGRVWRHGQTYAGHSACCAAGLANIAILEREDLIPRGRELEQDLFRTVSRFADHPLVGEVRGGVGLMAAVELDAELLERDPAAPGKLSKAIREEGGVVLRALGRSVAVSPPLTITVEEIGLIGDGIKAGLDKLLESTELAGAKAGGRAAAG